MKTSQTSNTMKDNYITQNENNGIIRNVALNDLITDGLQMRVEMSEECIERYANTYKETPDEMPPVAVFYDSKTGKHYLSDGFHRVEAMRRLKGLFIKAIVKEGDHDKALKEAAKANATNGLQRTKADDINAMQFVWDNWDTLYKNEKRTTPDGKPSRRQIISLCAVKENVARTFVESKKLGDSPTPDVGEGKKRGATTVSDDNPDERDPAVRKLLDVGRDRFGVEIPKRLVEAFKSADIKEISRQLKEVRKELENRKDAGDPAFTHISTFAISHVSAALRDFSFGKPYCVCRMCRGMGCASCSRLGFMTRSQYSMVPDEFRDSSRVHACACVNESTVQ